MIVGAGCSKQPSKQVQAPTPEQAMKEYDQATAIQGTEASYGPTDGNGRVSVTVPSDWEANGSIWRPKGSTQEHIRVSSFPKESAEEEWNKQQAEDVHQVLKASKLQDRFVLIVHHAVLKATIIKVFVPKADQAAGYTFGECRISDEHKDDRNLWNACKTAIESIH